MVGGRSVTGGDMAAFGALVMGGVGGAGLLSCPDGRDKTPAQRHFMSFRRAFIGLALCCVAPNASLAQSTRVVELSYEITFLGLTGFRIDFSGQFTGNSYDVQSHTFKQGLIKAMTIQYEGRNRAWGSFLQNAVQPTGGGLSLVVGGTTRTWAAQYGPGGM